MAADKEREVIKKLSPNNPMWIEKVNKMSDKQAVAIFLRLKSERKL